MRLKIFFYLLFTIVFLSAPAWAATGCSTYQGLYPDPLNTTHSTTGNVYYNNTNYIVYRTYDADPRCGIRENKVTGQNTACDVIGVRDYGVLVTYNPADNNCVVETPLDTHIWLMMTFCALLGVFSLKNKIIVNPLKANN